MNENEPIEAPNNGAPDPLDSLATQAQRLTMEAPQGEEPTPAEQAEQEAQEQQAAQAMAMLEAGTTRVILYGLQWTRAKIGKDLPEIHDEWTDETLQRPAEAVIPLIRKHMESLLVLVGTSPELAVFAMSLIPLLMGLMSATEKHEAKLRAEKIRAAMSSAQPVSDVMPNSETPVNA